MMSGNPAGAAAVQDAKVVYMAFKSNNALADVVLAYACTSYADLDRQLVNLEITRAQSLHAAVTTRRAQGLGWTASASDLPGAVKRCVP